MNEREKHYLVLKYLSYIFQIKNLIETILFKFDSPPLDLSWFIIYGHCPFFLFLRPQKHVHSATL